MEKKPALTVLCDMDGILVDLFRYWLDRIAEDYGVRVHPSEINQWSMHKCGMLQQLGAAKVYAYLQQPGFFYNAPALPGALEGLKQLIDLGHDVYIASSPSSSISAKEKFDWLAEKAPWLKTEKIFLANKKTMIRGDVLIDDHPDTALDYSRAWPDSLPIAIGYPYNIHLANHPNVVIAGNYDDTAKAWKGIVAAVEKFREFKAKP